MTKKAAHFIAKAYQEGRARFGVYNVFIPADIGTLTEFIRHRAGDFSAVIGRITLELIPRQKDIPAPEFDLMFEYYNELCACVNHPEYIDGIRDNYDTLYAYVAEQIAARKA